MTKENITYDSLTIYNKDEVKTWWNVLFDINYERTYPRHIPPITCQESFKLATGLCKDSFP